jgi:hypothetical protein
MTFLGRRGHFAAPRLAAIAAQISESPPPHHSIFAQIALKPSDSVNRVDCEH